MIPPLINLHGFLAASDSPKVIALERSLPSPGAAVEFIAPTLPDQPRAAFQAAEQLIQDCLAAGHKPGLMGHSLGGYFATFLAQKYDLRAVLVNPLVRAYELLCEYYGPCFNPHTGNHFSIEAADIQFLTEIYLQPLPEPSRFLVLLQAGDEILDPEEAREYYRGADIIVEPGGCHDFTGLERYTARVLEFLFGAAAR
ncbi:MAG: YqiA/YcfP family alpha/beta fold hydrolase [Pseudomonadota bacterium]|nr:esterase YqiA [Pseudomonadales bacterium]MDY6919341.1 YqiA/YcfP family alpha/beta fold hydrolase [Pseudomonadota bacterium]